MLAPTAPFPPRICFPSEEAYESARERDAERRAEQAETQRTLDAFMLVMIGFGALALGSMVVAIAWEAGGIWAIAKGAGTIALYIAASLFARRFF